MTSRSPKTGVPAKGLLLRISEAARMSRSSRRSDVFRRTQRSQPFHGSLRPRSPSEEPGDARTATAGRSALVLRSHGDGSPDQLRALTRRREIYRTQITAADLAAIILLQRLRTGAFKTSPATRPKLLEHLETLIVGEDENACPAETMRAHPIPARPSGRTIREFNIFHHRPPARRAADRGKPMLADSNEKEIAHLFRQRPAAERHQQPGAAAGHRQRGDPRQRRLLPDRRARPGRRGAAGRCDKGSPGGPACIRRRRRWRHQQFPAVAGHALHPGRRHGRQGAAR